MKKRLIVALVFTVIALSLFLAGRFSVDFADWYAINIYPAIETGFSYITGVIPFSFAEILLYAFIIALLFGITYTTIKVIKNRGYRVLTFFHIFSHYIVLFSVLFLLVTVNCLVNYNRSPFSEYSGLNVTGYSKEELRALADEVVSELNECSEHVETDENNLVIADENMILAAKNSLSYQGTVYSVLNVYYPNAKPVIASEIMSSFNIGGIFSPFTVESNYNNAMPDSGKGFTICHELSHLSGFMREDEANYIAYMACRTSMNNYLKYSGYFQALTYVLNAYGKVSDSDEYSELYNTICPQVRFELANWTAYWARYKDGAAAAVSHTVNDAYLKINNQVDGELSYGRMVDLMIADFIARRDATE